MQIQINLADERMLYNLMGIKNVDILINRAIDKVRENLTGEIRLLDMYQFNIKIYLKQKKDPACNRV